MKQNIICLLCILLLASLQACQKNDDNTAQKKVVKNALRVKQITGNNEWWGDYRMECRYKNEKLDTAMVYDKNGRIKGLLTGKYETGIITLSAYTFVPKIHPEDTALLDPDQIPMSQQRMLEIKYTINENLVSVADITYSGPKESEEDSYDYNYETKQKQHCLYEYDEQANLIIARVSGEYQKDDPILKYEFIYTGNRIVSQTGFTYIKDNWQIRETNEYSYSGDLLVRIITEKTDAAPAEKIEKEFHYSGKTLTQILITQPTGTTTIDYSFNNKGFVTKIDYGNNKITQIEYEDGNGNFSLFTLPTEQLTNIPFVK